MNVFLLCPIMSCAFLKCMSKWIRVIKFAILKYKWFSKTFFIIFWKKVFPESRLEKHRVLSRCSDMSCPSEPLVSSLICNHINHVAAFKLLNMIRASMFTICWMARLCSDKKCNSKGACSLCYSRSYLSWFAWREYALRHFIYDWPFCVRISVCYSVRVYVCLLTLFCSYHAWSEFLFSKIIPLLFSHLDIMLVLIWIP